MHQQNSDYEAELRAEIEIFKDWADIHELPEIAHYWSNSKIRPKQEALGYSSAYALFKLYLERQCQREPGRALRFISIGAGNCDAEVDFAKHLLSAGYSNFVIECLDINPAMLERGRLTAQENGVSAQIGFVEGDFNRWQPEVEYDAVLACHSLHHVVNLEGLFQQVRLALRPHGRFIIADMIGRNGHQRWPEALEIVEEFWRELPAPYRYNRMLKRLDEEFVNWDCSVEGFEGVRSQDILPLLLNHFHFELFLAYGNVIDPFVDRCFGHNFNVDAPGDRAFIDRVHQRDENAMLSGRIKPVHMEAVVGKEMLDQVLCHRPFTPEFCVRWPDPVPILVLREAANLAANLRVEIGNLQGDNAILSQKLDLAEGRLRTAADSRWLKLGNRLGLGPRLP